MSLPRYPEYRLSDLGWLAEYPSHWKRCRAKAFLVERNERSEDGSETLLSVSAYTGISPRSEIIDEGEHLSRADTLEGYKKCQPNDLVMNIMLAWNRGLGVSAHEGIVSPSYAVFELGKSVLPAYLHYLLRSDEAIGLFKMNSTGVIDSRLRLYPEVFEALSFALPSLTEQVAIATFLDRETAKIDTLVAEQERLIALLKEKRQAVISHAVTKGLNPDATMKDSGIEWLGDVPAHWSVTKTGRYLSILSGFAFPSSGFDHDGNGTRLLRGINVGVGEIRWDDVVFWERRTDDGLELFELKVGDLVIGMDRPLIGAGTRVARIGPSDVPCLLLQRVVSLRTLAGLQSEFLEYWLSSAMFVAHFLPDTTGVSVPHISPEQISSFVIANPPVEEQVAIVEFLGSEGAKFDALLAEAEIAVTLLRERRSALISAAVTGQIDVRGTA